MYSYIDKIRIHNILKEKFYTNKNTTGEDFIAGPEV